jgi:hypothetical protein
MLIFGEEAVDSLTICVKYVCGNIMGDILDGGDVGNSACDFSRWKGKSGKLAVKRNVSKLADLTAKVA